MFQAKRFEDHLLSIVSILFVSQESVSVVCTPLCAATGELEAVLELVRRNGEAFTEEDVETINSYLVWAGLALHFADKVCRNTEEKLLTDFLASVVSSISCDVVLVDSLLLQVINQCQKMILADRASIFLVDTKTNQLYARLFNISYDREDDSGVTDFNEEVIRFSVGEGVAGYVAQTGRSINLTDAYRSEHFNPGVDQEVLFLDELFSNYNLVSTDRIRDQDPAELPHHGPGRGGGSAPVCQQDGRPRVLPGGRRAGGALRCLHRPGGPPRQALRQDPEEREQDERRIEDNLRLNKLILLTRFSMRC